MLLHSCESISTRLEGTTSTSAECDQISIDHRPRALDGGAEVRESDIQASTDSPNRRRRNTARIDSKPANPLLIPSYAAGCVSQKNSPDLGGTPLTLTEVFGWMCVIPRLLRALLPPRPRRRGRPRNQTTSRAIILYRKLRKECPEDKPRAIWSQVYPLLIPGYADMPEVEQRTAREELQERIAWRRRKRRPRKIPTEITIS